MSSSTSPGNNSTVSSSPPVPTAGSSGLPLTAKADPAAFIDARIQVAIHCIQLLQYAVHILCT